MQQALQLQGVHQRVMAVWRGWCSLVIWDMASTAVAAVHALNMQSKFLVFVICALGVSCSLVLYTLGGNELACN